MAAAAEVLSSGAIRMLSAKWLIQQPDGWLVSRRQDLPEEAFLSPGEATRLLVIDGGLVIISYPWLSKPHPDPASFHFTRFIKRYLISHFRMHLWYGFWGPKQDDHGVFWDFASMPQKGPLGQERTAKEEEALDQGLKVINLLYSAYTTSVIQLKSLPESDGADLRTYDERGWCFFEEVVAGIQKRPNLFLNITTAALELERDPRNWLKVWSAAAPMRTPPMRPDSFAVTLESKRFTNNADVTVVSRIYEDFFNSIVPTVEYLCYPCFKSTCRWNMDVQKQFFSILPTFKAGALLDMKNHPLGDDGIMLLLEAVQQTNITFLALQDCEFTKLGLGALLEAVRNGFSSRPPLQKLELPLRLKDSSAGHFLTELESSREDFTLTWEPHIKVSFPQCWRE